MHDTASNTLTISLHPNVYNAVKRQPILATDATFRKLASTDCKWIDNINAYASIICNLQRLAAQSFAYLPTTRLPQRLSRRK